MYLNIPMPHSSRDCICMYVRSTPKLTHSLPSSFAHLFTSIYFLWKMLTDIKCISRNNLKYFLPCSSFTILLVSHGKTASIKHIIMHVPSPYLKFHFGSSHSPLVDETVGYVMIFTRWPKKFFEPRKKTRASQPYPNTLIQHLPHFQLVTSIEPSLEPKY